MANHKQREWEWKGKKFVAGPGQFITSSKSIEKNAGPGISRQNVRTALDKFEKYEFLTKISTKTGVLITITNWEIYQSKDEEVTNDITINQPTANQQLTTNKNDKECKNERSNTLESKDSMSASTDKVDFERIKNEFNQKCKSLPPIAKMTDKRKQSIRARVREHGQDSVFTVINNVSNSQFLRGVNDHNWSATFDWIIKPNNYIKVLEGNYNKGGGNGTDSGDDQYDLKKHGIGISL